MQPWKTFQKLITRLKLPSTQLKSFFPLKGKAKAVIWLIGYTLLIVLLTGCSPFRVGQQATIPPTSPAEATPLPTATPWPLPTSKSNESNITVEGTVTSPTATNSARDSVPAPAPEAKIGQITFALETSEQREPLNPSLLFTKGVTQVHAVFDYSGMSTAYTWERVWFLNDKEVSRKADAWTGSESGVFDYFIDNGGRPLPAGDWVLEIYVEGKLLSLGAFVIAD